MDPPRRHERRHGSFPARERPGSGRVARRRRPRLQDRTRDARPARGRNRAHRPHRADRSRTGAWRRSRRRREPGPRAGRRVRRATCGDENDERGRRHVHPPAVGDRLRRGRRARGAWAERRHPGRGGQAPRVALAGGRIDRGGRRRRARREPAVVLARHRVVLPFARERLRIAPVPRRSKTRAAPSTSIGSRLEATRSRRLRRGGRPRAPAPSK